MGDMSHAALGEPPNNAPSITSATGQNGHRSLKTEGQVNHLDSDTMVILTVKKTLAVFSDTEVGIENGGMSHVDGDLELGSRGPSLEITHIARANVDVVRQGEPPAESVDVADDNVVTMRKRGGVPNGATPADDVNRRREQDQYLKIREDDDEEEPLSILRKICFAVGGAPYQICSTIIGFYLNIFLLEVAQIPPKYISIVLFGGKAWDAITDPMCGYLVNRTETRFGKMRPWIILSAPFACVSYFFLWYVPDLSDEGKLAYYFVMFCAFEGLLSGLHVPYTALTMYISNKQKERDSATAYRMVLEAIGVLIGAIVQGILIEKYRTVGKCKEPDATSSPTELDNQKWSYMVGSGFVVAIYFVCACIVFVGVKEKKKGVADGNDHVGFFRGLKLVFSYGPYVKAAMTFLFLSITISIVQGNLALYCTHSLHMGSQFTYFILVLLLVSICTMPIWQLVVTRYGKKTAYASGMIIFIPVLIVQLYLPKNNPYLYYTTVAFAGLSVSVSLLLPWSVLPDILDMFMLERKTRKDALFYSFYVFFNKFSGGMGLAISQLALQFGGYKTGACVQPASVDLTLRMLIVPGPVLCLIVALLFLWSYPIDEVKRRQIKKDVHEILSDQGDNPGRQRTK
ncbi:sodium-dependent lysophosphatidylcholine symporter 1-B-like isoform X2 [Haliotis rubra]|uniref:sodium-dependent lysophosphatidylcholine symporter 1-B-like isoform X2 n=1 Tax=Haliotis rubra TaxID=36100 RepID=UPI001EE59871|nr:sodium-dependent lysophosphatidylcholine symporter 1-B-like isoform X2 [Haliotis rubra]